MPWPVYIHLHPHCLFPKYNLDVPSEDGRKAAATGEAPWSARRSVRPGAGRGPSLASPAGVLWSLLKPLRVLPLLKSSRFPASPFIPAVLPDIALPGAQWTPLTFPPLSLLCAGSGPPAGPWASPNMLEMLLRGPCLAPFVVTCAFSAIPPASNPQAADLLHKSPAAQPHSGKQEASWFTEQTKAMTRGRPEGIVGYQIATPTCARTHSPPRHPAHGPGTGVLQSGADASPVPGIPSSASSGTLPRPLLHG